MPDYYDRAVAYLQSRPRDELLATWGAPFRYPGGLLFQFCTPTGHAVSVNGVGVFHGCPTMVAAGTLPAWTASLTQAIRADRRMTAESHRMQHHHLPVLAEWQRRIDKELGRAPPVWPADVPDPLEVQP